jgi:hypothetical protein
MEINKKNMHHTLEGTVEIAEIDFENKEFYTSIKLEEHSNSYLINGEVSLNPGEKVRLYLPYKESLDAMALEVLDKEGEPSLFYCVRSRHNR